MRKLRNGSVVADRPHDRLNNVLTGHKRDFIRMVLPVLNGRAIRTTRDKSAVNGQVEPFVGRDVESERPVAVSDGERLAELEERDTVLVGCSNLGITPYPRCVVYRLNPQQIRIAAQKTRITEDSL